MTGCDCRLHLPKDVTRRDLLRASLAGAGLLALGPFGRRASVALGEPVAGLKRLVVVNLLGGNDTLNMFIPVTLTQYYTQRGALAIAPAAALPLNGTSDVMVHPSMPRVQALWNSGDAAIVQRVGYPSANLSHFESQDIFSWGVRNGFAALGRQPSGWIARYADVNAPTPLGAVSIGMGRPTDFVGGTTNPLLVSSLAGFRISGTNSTAIRTYRLQRAKEILESAAAPGLTSQARDAVAQAHDQTDQVQAALTAHNSYLSGAGIAYPSNTIANRLKDAAALIQGGFETRILYTGYGGFDTHGGQGTTTGTHATLLGNLDGALGAFSDEMKALGIWDDVVVLVITEFGRRTFVNGSAGTDHGHAYTGLVVGGAVSGGSSYGPALTDADLTRSQGYPGYAVDFRSIYKELISDHLGADAAEVFPEPLAIEQTLGLI